MSGGGSENRGGEALSWLDAVLSASMLSSVFWVRALQGASLLLHFIVLLCGAIIGIHSVRRIWRGKGKERANEEE